MILKNLANKEIQALSYIFVQSTALSSNGKISRPPTTDAGAHLNANGKEARDVQAVAPGKKVTSEE